MKSPRAAMLVKFAGALFLLTALLASACAGPDPQRQARGGESRPQLAADQTIRLQLSSEPKTLDPHKMSFGTDTSIGRQLFSPLLWFDADMKVIPWVATVVPSRDNGGISADGLIYTFHLRKDLKWSDDQPLTAQDFEWSFKRAMDPRTASKYASLYFDVTGAQDLNQATKASEAEIAALKARVGVRAIDDSTLEFTLRSPRSSFLQLAALWVMYPVRQDVIERHGDKWTEPGNLIGNGPFVLKEWEHNSKVVLSRNEHWFAPFGNKATLQTVVYRIIPDESVAWAAYLNNEIDVSRVPPASRREVLTDPNWKSQVLREPEPTTSGLIFNNSMPPFDRKEVRQAFAMAIDRTAFVNVVLQGAGEPAYSWIPPMVPGHDPQLGRDTLGFDPARARQILAQAGYPDGRGLPEVKITIRDTDVNRGIVVPFLQEQFRRNLGVELKAELLEARAYSSAFGQSQFQLVLAGWHADYPDQDGWLPNLFGCLKYDGGKCTQYEGNNVFRYSNPQFDELTSQAKRELDPARRDALWANAQRLLVQDVAMAPINTREMFRVVKPWVRDLKYVALDSDLPGDHYLFDVFIAQY